MPSNKPIAVKVERFSGSDWITDRCPVNWCDFCCLTGDKCDLQKTGKLPRRCPLKKGPVTINVTEEEPTV